MVWWLWVILGIALLVLEVATPSGFFLFFFGIGAILVGAADAIGIVESASVEWLLFTVVSLASVALLRKPLRDSLGFGRKADDLEDFVGERGKMIDDLAPDATGQAELRGTTWTARNVGDRALARGESVRVERVDGLTLHVRADN